MVEEADGLQDGTLGEESLFVASHSYHAGRPRTCVNCKLSAGKDESPE